MLYLGCTWGLTDVDEMSLTQCVRVCKVLKRDFPVLVGPRLPEAWPHVFLCVPWVMCVICPFSASVQVRPSPELEARSLARNSFKSPVQNAAVAVIRAVPLLERH